MGTHFFTSLTANYLPKARILCESIRRFHPSATIHAVWNDKTPEWLDLTSEPFDHLVTVEDLGIPHLASWLFQHDLVELNTAVKGYALQRLLARADCEQAVYLDPDIVLLKPLDGLLKHFGSASILVTPHQCEPETSEETVRENELLTLQHGIFNLGFLGVKNSPEGRRFARWWTDRLRDYCYDDIPIGLFTDQRWPDLIPAFFPDHQVVREPVYNVAYWNLTQRRMQGSVERGFTVDGQALVFFHFSGIDSGRDLAMLRSWGMEIPAFLELREWYLAECDRQGQAVLSCVPWAYGFFGNGDAILRPQRIQYRDNPDLQARFPDPFQTFPAQIKPASMPAKVEQEARRYRIFVIAAPADERYLDETLRRLKSNTVQQEQVWVVTRTPTGERQSIAVDAIRYEDFAAHVLRHFADQDMILLRAGAWAPPQWDVRLAWAAARHESALTMSPLDRRVVDEGGLLAATEAEELDRLCYFYRQAEEREVARFSQDCVYINSAAVRNLAASRNGLRLTTLMDSAARQRWQHLETTDLCVSFQCPRHSSAPAQETAAEQHFLNSLRANLRNHASSQFYIARNMTAVLNGATLHISHNWGGGIEQWLRSFCEADETHEHFVLKSVGPQGMFGGQLELHRYGLDEGQVLRSWKPEPAIRATALTHVGYQQIVKQIREEFAVGRVIVSSLIGHSLDGLRTGLPTVLVCHDYYPYCPAINLAFGETCRSCEAPRLEACLEENPLNSHFPNVAGSEWQVLRGEFLRTVVENSVTLVAPSASVEANYLRHAPELAGCLRVIPHGMRAFPSQRASTWPATQQPLRVLMLGSLVPHKGVFLLESMLPELLTFADLTLAGCLASGDGFAGNPKIRVIPEYRQEDLAGLIEEIRPDVGLLLSIWPETFSYTLHELQSLCVPPVAIKVGAFLDAIEEGQTGFLCEAEPCSILNRLRALAADRAALERVRGTLGALERRSIPAMVEDYARLMPDSYSAARYFGGPRAPETLPELALQIYWCEPGGAFAEANSFRFSPYHRHRQTARLYVPALHYEIGRLRFDPGSAAGLLQLNRLTLCRKTGEVLWWSEDCRTLVRNEPQLSGFPLSATVLALTGDDPQFELPVPADQLAALARSGGYLEVDFAWHHLDDHLPELLAEPAIMFEKLMRDLAAAGEQLQKVQAALEQVQQQFGSQQQQLELSRTHSENLASLYENVTNSLSWRVTKPLRRAGEMKRKLTGQG